EIRLLAIHLSFDTSRLRDMQAAVQAMNERLLQLIARLSAVADGLQALQRESSFGSEMRQRLDEVAAWLRAGAPLPSGRVLAEALRAAASRDTGDWQTLLEGNVLEQLAHAVDVLGECHGLLAHLREPDAVVALDLARAIAEAREHPLHRDVGLALR